MDIKKEKVDFSIERGFRSFENKEDYKNLAFYNFYVIQFSLEKESFSSGEYQFYLINNKDNKEVFQRTIIVDINKKSVITPNSHEDPLIESEEYYMLCFQLWDNDINEIKRQLKEGTYSSSFLSNDLKVILKKNNKIISNVIIKDLYKYFQHDFIKRSSIIDDYFITTTEDCLFRVHLGYDDGSYEEIEKPLKKGEKINFHKYLKNPYVGLQCSYEYENIEIEEKHIVVGLKSMTLSGVYNDGDKNYYPLLPFESKYQILFINDENRDINLDNYKEYPYIIKEKWNEINSIEDLVKFYKDKKINYFESSYFFLESQYKNSDTYGLNKTYSNIRNTHNKRHVDLGVCKGCDKKTKCIQIVPSNLSYQLFKENIYLNNEKDCVIYSLIT